MTNFSKFLQQEGIFSNNESVLTMPYIIAEIGVNHEGSIEKAKEMILSAKENGAHAVKFQSYKAHKLASKNSPAYWDISKEKTLSQYELFKKHDSFNENEFIELKTYCNNIKIDFSSTPFDFDSARYLNNLCEFFKISSSDLNNLPFIDFISDFGKPIILSVGASKLNEIERSVELITSKNIPLILLHCVLNYPTDNHNANLGAINYLSTHFPNLMIGYSDHTMPGKNMNPCTVAFLLGAKVIEKHYTFNKDLPGNDHYHAMDSKDLALYVKNIEKIIELYGVNKINIDSQDSAIMNARRSLYFSKNLPQGHVLCRGDIEIKRPGIGLEPEKLNEVIGQTLAVDVTYDELVEIQKLQ